MSEQIKVSDEHREIAKDTITPVCEEALLSGDLLEQRLSIAEALAKREQEATKPYIDFLKAILDLDDDLNNMMWVKKHARRLINE